MRDLTFIQNSLPELRNRLALMYSDLVKESKRYLNVDKTDFFEAEATLSSIDLYLQCETDLVILNKLYNQFISLVENCCPPDLDNPEVIELECNKSTDLPTYWVPCEIDCQEAFQFYGTVTSFDNPDALALVYDDDLFFEVILKAETGVNKQYVEAPVSFGKNIAGAYYFNESISAYMPQNKISEFLITDVTKSNLPYKRYTYNGSKRGTTKVKFVFE